MYINSNKDAEKVIGLLIDAKASLKDKKQEEAINAACDLIDELVLEGRF